MPNNFEFDVEDIEYLRHGTKPLLARLYKPRGTGPFPAMVEVHGGAWCQGDRLQNVPTCELLAKSGIVVASLDFRMPPEASYPASMVDINFGIRWLKSRAQQLGSRQDWVGALGNSSGGHQVMLAGMRPHHPAYATVPLPGNGASFDASLRCVVMSWPVIDPLGRYRYAKKLKAGGKPYPAFVDGVLPLHDAFWRTEEAMAEGNPVMMLERGESVELPPALYIQFAGDLVHPRADLERFVQAYRKAGGYLQLELFEGDALSINARDSSSPAFMRTIERTIDFIHQQIH
jgi:acetyl esterase